MCSILRFERFICEPAKIVPYTDLYAIYKSSCSIIFCEKVSSIRHSGVLFICATRYYHSGVSEYANLLLPEALSFGSARNTFFRHFEIFTTEHGIISHKTPIFNFILVTYFRNPLLRRIIPILKGLRME
jgi:hypothetical protein